MMVFDGVSISNGQTNGQLAARLIGGYMDEEGSRIVDEKTLIESVRDLNTILHENKTASTLVATIVRGDEATVYNIGDSRAYVVREGELLSKGDRCGYSYSKQGDDHWFKNFLGAQDTPDLNLNLQSSERNLGKTVVSTQNGDLIFLLTDGYYDEGYESGSVKGFIQRRLSTNAERYKAANKEDRVRMMVEDIEEQAMYAENNDDRALFVAEVRIDSKPMQYLRECCNAVRRVASSLFPKPL